MKLQQAYISEAVAVGNWKIIGYKGPGNQDASALKSSTTNFEYTDGGDYSEANTTTLGTSNVKGFAVKNLVKLNDCEITADNWTVNVKKADGSEGEAEFTSATNCTELTPNFAKIGK